MSYADIREEVTMHKTVRTSVDFPDYMHVYLKMYCAKKGLSIRQYIIDTVMKSMEEESEDLVDDETFKKAADKLMKEKKSLWKRLSNR